MSLPFLMRHAQIAKRAWYAVGCMFAQKQKRRCPIGVDNRVWRRLVYRQ
ncbi:hypothetical protein CES86_0018 [Brucella lupini]|uniref:Uncharacterized protein n=1 Tax=Brucella lupini TaxID=255457 RepID=A0A256GYX9_9HYPH|nr:hypothetical protein CES86_0018 [Brucella lupini]